MSPSYPENLTRSTAYLTDKPYDVQLGVLRWVRGLLSEVIDNAASQLSTKAAASEEQGIAPQDNDGGSYSRSEEDYLLPDAEERGESKQPQRIRRQGDAKDSSEAVHESHAARGAGQGGSTGVGREHPSTPKLRGRGAFGPGCVVECFHPDDGLWYPATITAVIPLPSEAPTERVVSLEEVPGQEVAAGGPTAEALGGEKEPPLSPPLRTAPSFGSILPSPTTGPTALPGVHVAATEGEEGGPSSQANATWAGEEEDGVHSFVMVDSSTAAAVAAAAAAAAVIEADSPAVGEKEEMQQEVNRAQQRQQQRELLDVVFLGYGNQSRVPRDWVREIVTPEVLEWCKEKGVVAASVERETEEASAPTEGSASAGASAAGTTGEGEAPTTIATTTAMAVCAETPDTAHSTAAPAVRKVGGNEDQRRAAEGGAAVAPGRVGSGGSGGEQGKQQPRKRKKNKKNNNRNHKKGGGGNQQIGTEEEEEERFLMRYASRARSPYPHVPNKYWGQRYRYFTRFDEGITMDEEGWYSVTPEAIARHIAERVCCDVVVDPFVGCGGNAVQFAMVAHLVFAIDIDPNKLEHARRNAAIYGVENRIEFILGDAMKVLPTLKADVVFLSPPWGGPGYSDSQTFDLNSMIPPPLSALEMFRTARKVTPNVVFFLPRNVDVLQVAGLPAAAAAAATAAAVTSEAVSAAATVESGKAEGKRGAGLSFDDTCELEKHFLNGKLKTTTAYFGEDIAVAWSGGKEKARRENEAGSGVGGAAGDGAEALSHQAGVGAVDDTVNGQDASSDWYGGDGKGAAAWSGRHVRFSEDEDGDDSRGGGGVGVRKTSVGGQERENALYEAWMAT